MPSYIVRISVSKAILFLQMISLQTARAAKALRRSTR